MVRGKAKSGHWLVDKLDLEPGATVLEIGCGPGVVLRVPVRGGAAGRRHLSTWGSTDMVGPLLAAGLVDGLRLMIYPVLLGRSKRLFGDNAQPSAFTLAHSTSTPGGVRLTRYARSGEVRTGAPTFYPARDTAHTFSGRYSTVALFGTREFAASESCIVMPGRNGCSA